MMLEHVVSVRACDDISIKKYLHAFTRLVFDIFFGLKFETNYPPILRPNNQEDEQIIASLTQDLRKLRKATTNVHHGHPVGIPGAIQGNDVK